MINFPLQHPTEPGFRSLTLRMANIAGLNVSPFSGQQQSYEFTGEWWEAEVSLPPIVLREVAEPWICLFAALRGQVGTFLLGDSSAKWPQGPALGSPQVPRTGLISAAASKTLVLGGWEPNVPYNLLAGDYIEIGRNFLSSPSAFWTADWLRLGVGGAASSVTAPDGSITADTLIIGTGETVSQVVEAPRMVAGTTFTFRVWLKVPTTSPASGPIPFLLSIKKALDTSPVTYETIGEMQVQVTDIWGYFEVAGELDADTTAILVEIKNEEPEETVYAWGASLDDAVTGRRLYKNLTDTDTDDNGFSTHDIFPRLREVPDEGAPINLINTKGTFRLADNRRSFSLNEAKVYGIEFRAVESF